MGAPKLFLVLKLFKYNITTDIFIKYIHEASFHMTFLYSMRLFTLKVTKIFKILLLATVNFGKLLQY